MFGCKLGNNREQPRLDKLIPLRKAAKGWAAKMQSEEYLNLQREDRPATAMQPLKISARVFIHAAEKEFDGRALKFNFLVKDGLIAEAHIQSYPHGIWSEMEDRLREVEFEEWGQIIQS